MPILETRRHPGVARPSVFAKSICFFVAATTIGFDAHAGTEDPSTKSAESATVTAEVKQKAMGHFETGLRLYEDGDFSLALIEFERAYSYIPDYRVLYNIGQVSVQLGRYARASQALEQYLQNGGSSIPAARSSSVREDLKMLEGRTAHVQVSSNVEEAELLLDDVRIALTPMLTPMLVDAGEHRLTLQKPGFVTRSERIVLAGRDDTKLQLDLTEVPKSAPAPLQPVAALPQSSHHADSAARPQPMATRTQWLYIGAGATGLFAVGWAVTGYLGIKAAGDLHEALQGPTTQGKLDSLRSNARSALLASDILGAAAIATGATTIYFVVKGPNRETTKDQDKAQAVLGVRRVGIAVGPTAIQVTGSF